MVKFVKNVTELETPIPGFDEHVNEAYYQEHSPTPYLSSEYLTYEIDTCGAVSPPHDFTDIPTGDTTNQYSVLRIHNDVNLTDYLTLWTDDVSKPFESPFDTVSVIYTELIYIEESDVDKYFFLLARDKASDVPVGLVNILIDIDDEDSENGQPDARIDLSLGNTVWDDCDCMTISNLSNIRTMLKKDLISEVATLMAVNTALLLRELPVKLHVGSKMFNMNYTASLDDIQDIAKIYTKRIIELIPCISLNYDDWDDENEEFIADIKEVCDKYKHIKW